MLNTVDGPSESVEDYLCDPEEMPLGARESRLPCPEDCVLNDWGPWSRCSMVREESRPGSTWHRLDRTNSAKPTEIYLDIFFLSQTSSPRLRQFRALAAPCYCEQRVKLCQQVISRPPRRNKGDPWSGKQEKVAYTSPILHRAQCAVSREGRWFMIKSNNSGVGFQLTFNDAHTCMQARNNLPDVGTSLGRPPRKWKTIFSIR